MKLQTAAIALGTWIAIEPAQAQSTAALSEWTAEPSEQRSSRVVELQVLLDRVRHSPGVVDGRMGNNTRRAIEAYQRSVGREPTGRFNRLLVQSLRQSAGGAIFQDYTLTQDDVEGPFRSVPSTMTGKADLDRVAFEDPAEMLAEKFHMARKFLESLNPGADFGKAGTTIKVVRPGTDKQLPQVARIEVDKESNELRAFSRGGQIVATYPTTVGSNVHPSPSDTLEVLAVAPEPTYHFDPSGRTWGPDEQLTVAPGPNNPVGIVWIDLSRDGYGIHGTPEPQLIGKTSSHGCVRLTNWDAQELSRAVEKGTTVRFR